MRLKKKEFMELLERNGLTVEELAKRLFLPVREIQWAADGWPVSSQFAEILAEALGVSPKEIVKPESVTTEENFLEYITGADQASVTFSQKRMVTRIRQLSEKYPEECRIVAVNKDRSIMAHVPVAWIRVSPPRKVEMTDEKKEQLRDRLQKNIRRTSM